MDYNKVLELQKVKIFKAQKRLGMDTPETMEAFYALFNAGTSAMLYSKDFEDKCEVAKKEIFDKKYKTAQAQLKRKNEEMAELDKIKHQYEEKAKQEKEKKQAEMKAKLEESLNLSAEDEKSLFNLTSEIESEDEQKQQIKRIKLEGNEGENEKKSDGET
ncbi:hypothetical protein PVAND_013557 [Polypedilum vanderplanki]|uniref:Uncharacterized protein n=1 Tax=Polypedilum vanderplanki TaxID=319348 RepID=A0A9J6CPS6_POLVA|nr:hypothetical protein PVAND_013557 [Polypedilum vanderplanki]